MNNNLPLKWKIRNSIGLAAMAIYLICVSIYISFKWDDLMRLRLNELGDFCTGVLSPIGILWLVLGFYQQSEELRLTNQELIESIKQSKRMAESTEAALHFEIEKAYRDSSPKFVFLGLGGSRTTLEISIQNIGSAISNVMIQTDPDELIGSEKSLIAWGASEMRRIRRTRIDNTVLPDTIRLVINYTDILNRPRRHRLELSSSEPNSMKYICLGNDDITSSENIS